MGRRKKMVRSTGRMRMCMNEVGKEKSKERGVGKTCTRACMGMIT